MAKGKKAINEIGREDGEMEVLGEKNGLSIVGDAAFSMVSVKY